MPEEQCTRPPKGWKCTRGAHHEGPCAAWPVSTPEEIAAAERLAAEQPGRFEVIELDPELVERAARAALDTFHVPKHPLYVFDTTTEAYRQVWRDVARAVLEAAQPASPAGGGLLAVSGEELPRGAEPSEPSGVSLPEGSDRFASHARVGVAEFTSPGDAPRAVDEIDNQLGGPVGVGEVPHAPSLSPPAREAAELRELVAELLELARDSYGFPGAINFRGGVLEAIKRAEAALRRVEGEG